MIRYYQVKGSKENEKRIAKATKLHNPFKQQYKFSLTIDTFYYIHSLEKSQ